MKKPLKATVAAPVHEAVYPDLVKVLKKYEHLGGVTILAIASNMVGKLIALQDQTKYTPAQILHLVNQNIMEGNDQALATISGPVAGHG